MEPIIQPVETEAAAVRAELKKLRRAVTALAVVVIALVAVSACQIVRARMERERAQRDFKMYLQNNPVSLPMGSDVKEPVKGASFQVYEFR